MKHKPTLGDIYGEMLRGVKVVTESAQENINKSKKVVKQPKSAFSEQNPLQKGGPQEKSGFHKALNDKLDYQEDEEDETPKKFTNLQNMKKKLKNGNLSDKEKESLKKKIAEMEKGFQGEESEERIMKESKKIARKRLNTFMTKKSTFDKLYESVMGGAFDQQEDAQEVDALGLGDSPTDSEFGSEDMGEEDQVTITLDRAIAQQFLDLLQAAVGGEEEDFGGEDDGLDFEGEDDFGGEGEVDEDAEEEDDGMDYQEDEERGVHPTDKVGNDGTVGAKDSKGGGQQHKLQQKNNKVSGKPQPKNQTTKVVGTTDKVGNDGDHGHAISSGKQPDMGKQNKVSDLRQAEDYFR